MPTSVATPSARLTRPAMSVGRATSQAPTIKMIAASVKTPATVVGTGCERAIEKTVRPLLELTFNLFVDLADGDDVLSRRESILCKGPSSPVCAPRLPTTQVCGAAALR